MDQARVVDVHVYYRTGGINWAKLKANFDAVIIQAAVGNWQNPLLREQVDGAVSNGVPYATYFIPDIQDGTMQSQVDFYWNLPGVKDAWTCLDIEPPNKTTRCINNTEAQTCAHALENKAGRTSLMYSSPNIIQNHLGNPDWLTEYYLWLAQYYYEFGFPLYQKYTMFEPFLSKYADQYPGFIKNTKYQATTILWQFTDKGNAQELCANEHTLDPVYTHGISDADLNMSTVEQSVFLNLMGLSTPPPPLPPPAPITINSRGMQINIRNAPVITPATDVGDALLMKAEVIEELPEWYLFKAYVAKSVTSPNP